MSSQEIQYPRNPLHINKIKKPIDSTPCRGIILLPYFGAPAHLAACGQAREIR